MSTSSTSARMCQAVVAKHNCLHRATRIKKCAAAIEKERGAIRPTVWTKMASFLPGSQHRIEPPNLSKHVCHGERLTIFLGCGKPGYNDSHAAMIQESEDANHIHAKDIQLGNFVGQGPPSSRLAAASHVPHTRLQPPPRLAARPPHRSRFAQIDVVTDASIFAQQRPGTARQNTMRSHTGSNTTKQSWSMSRRPPNHRGLHSHRSGDKQMPTPIMISLREVSRNRVESKPLPPIPRRQQKQVLGRANSSGKRYIPRKPVAPPKLKSRSPAPPPLQLRTFGSITEASPRSSPLMKTSSPHVDGNPGRLRTPELARTPQNLSVGKSTVNATSHLSAVIVNAEEDLYPALMDSYFLLASNKRTARHACSKGRVNISPCLAPTVHHPSTSPPPSLRPGRRDAISATPENIGVDLDSVEVMFNTAASQAQARNDARNCQGANTPVGSNKQRLV